MALGRGAKFDNPGQAERLSLPKVGQHLHTAPIGVVDEVGAVPAALLPPVGVLPLTHEHASLSRVGEKPTQPLGCVFAVVEHAIVAADLCLPLAQPLQLGDIHAARRCAVVPAPPCDDEGKRGPQGEAKGK